MEGSAVTRYVLSVMSGWSILRTGMAIPAWRCGPVRIRNDPGFSVEGGGDWAS